MKVYLPLGLLLTAGLIFSIVWVLNQPKPVSLPLDTEAGLYLKPCQLKYNEITYRAKCGTLIAPENRQNSEARLISLPVKYIFSPNPHPSNPIFHLEGGPGSSNVNFKPPAWLLDNHDLVLVGYRGVDGTPRLDCPEAAQAFKGLNGNLLSDESLENFGKAITACATRLQNEGVDLAGYTIPEVVEDLEMVRSGLGLGRINLLSESYGTRVAQIYAAMYPDSLQRSAMIGVNPPGHFIWYPEVSDAQITYYSDLWKKTAGETAPDLAAAMRSVNAAMPSRWLFIPIDPGKTKLIAFFLLFHRSTAPIVFDAYLAAAHGDPSGLALMSLAYDFTLPGMMTWGDFFAKGYTDFQPGFDYRARLNLPNPIIGAPMSYLLFSNASGRWPDIIMPDAYRHVNVSHVETLLISGSIDFSTPAQFAEDELLPSLQKGRHIIIAEQGHTGDFWQYQPAAAERLLTSFFNSGEADASRYTYLPMDFKPKLSFPILAKILLGTGILLLVCLGFFFGRLITHRSRRSSSRPGKV